MKIGDLVMKAYGNVSDLKGVVGIVYDIKGTVSFDSNAFAYIQYPHKKTTDRVCNLVVVNDAERKE